MVLWLVAVLALAVAGLAWRQARRTATRLEQVSQLYWDLKYQQGEIRVLIRQSGGDPTATDDDRAAGAGPAAGPPIEGFVPIASLKR